MSNIDSIKETKKELRRSLIEKRRSVLESDPELAQKPSEQLQKLSRPKGAVISAYWPMNDEIDPCSFLHEAFRQDHTIGLPVVVAKGEALIFRRWQPGDRLLQGKFGESYPGETASQVFPDFLIVPLLAFDRRGYRLGYGGGFYDRSLRQIRKERECLAVGLALSFQEQQELPITPYDERLDLIVTEREIIKPHL